jgi:creatinine amidohydrolase
MWLRRSVTGWRVTTVTLAPSIYQAALADVLRSFYHHGFRRFFLVNGHGGNEPSIMTLFQELKHEGYEGATFHYYNWWKLPDVAKLAKELYGDREGSHATPSEVSMTFYLENIKPRSTPFVSPDKDMPWPPSANEMRACFPTGVIRADSSLARAEDGKTFLKVAARNVATLISRASVFPCEKK